MSDAVEIHNLLSDDQFNKAMTEYTSSEYLYILDQNNGSYSSGQIRFDTNSAKDVWTVWQDAYLMIPLSVKSSGAVYDDSALLAFKNSVVSCISGLLLSTSSGNTIVNESTLQLINTLRLHISKSFDSTWGQADLFFAKDSNVPAYTARKGIYTSGRSATCNNNPCQFQSTFSSGLQTTYNPGFDSRVQFFKQQCTLASNIFSLTVFIPLRLIHPIFDALNMPQINTRYLMTFYTPINGNSASTTAISANCPVQAGTDGTTPTLDPVVWINSTTRLYYKKVTFHPELNQKLAQKLQAGYSRTVEFNVCDQYLLRSASTAQSSFTDLISPSTVSPKRLFLVHTPAGAVNSNSICVNFPGQITNANVLVNNQNYYSQDLQNDKDFWNILYEQMPALNEPDTQGNLITYQDFLNTHKIYCFDLSRIADRLKNPTEAVSITLRYTRVDNTSCDVYALVERGQAVKFYFSASETKVLLSGF